MLDVAVNLESFLHLEAFRYAHWYMKSLIKSSLYGCGFAYNEQIQEQTSGSLPSACGRDECSRSVPRARCVLPSLANEGCVHCYVAVGACTFEVGENAHILL